MNFNHAATSGAFSDGVPTTYSPSAQARPEGPLPHQRGPGAGTRVSRLLQFEGPRGYATRTAIYLRYLVFALQLLIIPAVISRITARAPMASGDGVWMLFSVAVMLGAAAVGTMLHPTERHRILRDAKHFVMGIVVWPGFGLALFMWVTSSSSNGQVTGSVFSNLLSNAAPIMYFAIVFIPALVFVKLVAGSATISRSMEDTQVILNRITRQDGHQV